MDDGQTFRYALYKFQGCQICFNLRRLRAEDTHPNPCSSEFLPVMHAAVHNLVAQGLVCTL
jgi:hypothetical protein